MDLMMKWNMNSSMKNILIIFARGIVTDVKNVPNNFSVEIHYFGEDYVSLYGRNDAFSKHVIIHIKNGKWEVIECPFDVVIEFREYHIDEYTSICYSKNKNENKKDVMSVIGCLVIIALIIYYLSLEIILWD